MNPPTDTQCPHAVAQAQASEGVADSSAATDDPKPGQLLLRLGPSPTQVQTVWIVRIVLRVFSMGCQNTDEIRQELKTGRAISSLEASARPLLLPNLVEPILQPLTLF